MIAADTSTWVAYLEGAKGKRRRTASPGALRNKQALHGARCAHGADERARPASLKVAASLVDLPLIQITTGYWQRAGLLRAKVVGGRAARARLGDAADRAMLYRRESATPWPVTRDFKSVL